MVLVVVSGWFVLGAATGLPGPGPLRRYAHSDLEALVQKIEAAPPGPFCAPWEYVRPRAHVDRLRSRVVIEPSRFILEFSDRELQMLDAARFQPVGINCP